MKIRLQALLETVQSGSRSPDACRENSHIPSASPVRIITAILTLKDSKQDVNKEKEKH